MRLSQMFTRTSKTAPADETAASARLLTRAGYIHKEMAGVYAYLPLGLKVLENIKRIVRDEMNGIGGQEVMMTVLQPRELWELSGRWDDAAVDNWFKTKLANGTEVGLGMSHEEPVVDALSGFIDSYKDLPLYIYQIQTKFRNELRARSGLLRGREFVMKDMYSLSRDSAEHDQLYEKAVEAYLRVYDRLGLGPITYRTVADGGIFTDRFSDEFQTLSDAGEDIIYLHQSKRLAVNKEVYNPETLARLGLKAEDLVEKRAIEVGNTFHLESKYTDALNVYFADQNGHRQPIIMGCYGIGISRLMGVVAEVFADDRGLVWPAGIAPAMVYLARLGSDGAVVRAADELYAYLTQAGIEVIYDDRDERAGAKFADADLLGIPYRLVVSDKTLAGAAYELKARTADNAESVSRDQLHARLTA